MKARRRYDLAFQVKVNLEQPGEDCTCGDSKVSLTVAIHNSISIHAKKTYIFLSCLTSFSH